MTSAGPLKNGPARGSVIEERRALLQRVLWSRQIEKSARIRDFLAYVCERALEDPSVGIHEQEIGYRVFGRTADYDTTADNLVRVTASQARKKLEQYFASDGAAEPVILEIPKGQYTPVFHKRNAPILQPVEAAPQPESAKPEPKRSLAIPILAACVALLGCSTIWFAVKWRAEQGAVRSELDANPKLRALWSQLLPRAESGRTDIVIADSSLSLVQELLDRQLTLAEYLSPDRWIPSGRFDSDKELAVFARRAAQRRFTSLASVTAVYRIGQLAGRDQRRISFFSARDFNIRQMKSDNVVLLGSSRANPWMELIQDSLNFRFGFDQKSHFAYFENRDPRSGEMKIYRTDSSVSYCQIAFLPNLGKTANILAIGGTEVEGTEGGSEFITSERSLAQLESVVKPEKDGHLPYFEALLKSSRIGGATPGFSIVAVRFPHP
jgi:hypothetical protein